MKTPRPEQVVAPLETLDSHPLFLACSSIGSASSCSVGHTSGKPCPQGRSHQLASGSCSSVGETAVCSGPRRWGGDEAADRAARRNELGVPGSAAGCVGRLPQGRTCCHSFLRDFCLLYMEPPLSGGHLTHWWFEKNYSLEAWGHRGEGLDWRQASGGLQAVELRGLREAEGLGGAPLLEC